MTIACGPLQEESIDRLARLSPAALSDANDDGVQVLQRVDAVHANCTLVGTARTVRLDPDGLVAPIETLGRARSGEVIVIDAGDVSEAVWGELLSTYAERNGVVGVVTNGAVRDVSRIRERSFPVFARAHTPRGPSGSEEDESDVPVTVDGVDIEPGDVLVGDEDGVAVVRRDVLEEAIEAAERVEADERAVRERIERGDDADRAFEPLG
jgi:regulator of RNase E activity RraA